MAKIIISHSFGGKDQETILEVGEHSLLGLVTTFLPALVCWASGVKQVP